MPGRGATTKPTPSRRHRAHLRSRRIVAVIPEPADQAGHRQRKGLRSGWPVGYETEDYQNRNVIERAFNVFKNWRGLATRYDCEDRWCRLGVAV